MAESFNHFPAVAAGLKPALQQIESERLLDLEAKVKAFAPVDTGFLRSSVYSVLPDGTSDYGNAIDPPGDAYLLPEEATPSDMSGIVGVAANYAEYVNYGTYKMAAQPFFDQATEAAGSEFEAKFAELEGLLGGMI